MAAPTSAPTIEELQQNPLVQEALEVAWNDSLPHDPAARHEEGGWLYMNLKTGAILIVRAPAGLQAELEIGNPPLHPDCTIVGTFHTHPNPTAEGWDPRPSDTDELLLAELGVPGLIRADNGVHTAGPPSRRGGLGSSPGFPP